MIGYPSLESGYVTDWTGLAFAHIIEVRSGVIVARLVDGGQVVVGTYAGERMETTFTEEETR